MSYLALYAQFTDKDGDTQVIDDVKDISISIGSELKNNSMKLTVHNNAIDVLSDGTTKHRWVDSDGNAIFQAVKASSGDFIDEELVDVYAYYTDTDPTTSVQSNAYLLFTGVITKGKVQYEEKQTVITLDTKDRSAVILDRMTIPTPFDEQDGWTTPTIVKEIIRNSAENKTSNTGFDYDGNFNSDGTGWLIDARLFSEGIKSTGTVDSVSTRTITDTRATFISDGVERDMWVRNTNGNEHAYISEVVSDTQLKLTKPIFSSGDGYEVSDGFIQDTRIDGPNVPSEKKSFPKVTFSQLDKPVYESIDTLAQIENINTPAETDTETGTLVIKRAMRYYIDKKNRFHMYVPSNTPELIMELGQTGPLNYDEVQHDINKLEMTNSVDETINFIIFRAGEDMDNDMIRSFSRVAFSGTPQTKECVRHWLHIARSMKQSALEAGEITKVQGEEFNYPTSYEPLPTGNDYPVWYSGARDAPSDDTDYNDLFKEEAIKQGKKKAGRIFRNQANPRWKGSVQLRGEPIVVGDLIQFTSRPHGVNDIKVRVKSLSHNFSAETGWNTSIDIEEDEVETDKLTGV